MVVVVANRIPVEKGWEKAFEERWRNRKWSLAKSPGFVRTEVLRPVKGETYIVQTHWRSMKDFERWTRSAEFHAAHANPPPREAFAGPNVLEIHEIFASKERPARRTRTAARPKGRRARR